MKKDELLALRNEAELTITQIYSKVEDLKNQLNQANVELERYRGEYRAYDKLVTIEIGREQEQAKADKEKK